MSFQAEFRSAAGYGFRPRRQASVFADLLLPAEFPVDSAGGTGFLKMNCVDAVAVVVLAEERKGEPRKGAQALPADQQLIVLPGIVARIELSPAQGAEAHSRRLLRVAQGMKQGMQKKTS